MILVFDQTRPESLSNIQNWKNELYTHVGKMVPFILLRNKSGLKRKIDQSALDKFLRRSEREFMSAKTHYIMQYLNTSARPSSNVAEVFAALSNVIKFMFEYPYLI